MQIQIDDSNDLAIQASAAGFSSVDHYVQSLLDRDRERLAIQEGINAAREGRVQSLEEFDREFREKNGIV